MNAGYVVGADQVPDDELAVRVGDPLSTLHTEAAGLLQLHTRLGVGQQDPLMAY